MNSQSIFDGLQEAIHEACSAKELGPVRRAAESFGLREVPTGPPSQVLSEFWYEDPDGSSIRLTARWFDPSGPFQNIPDITRIRLLLSKPGEAPKEFSGEYDD